MDLNKTSIQETSSHEEQFRNAYRAIDQVSKQYKYTAYFSIAVDYQRQLIEIVGTNFERRFLEFLSDTCKTNMMEYSITYVPHMVVINVYKL